MTSDRALHELKAPQVLIEHIERDVEASLWGEVSIIRPAVVRGVLGNGGKLAFVTPLMSRPNYYAILVDSSWSEDDLGERSELLLRTIEESFGNNKDESDEEDGNDDGQPWPALHDGGHSWGFIDDLPHDVHAATFADIEQQKREQKAFFIGAVRITPGAVLDHPEFGQVQARLNDTLGWHYCRRGVLHELKPGDTGFSTDFNGVTVKVLSYEDGPLIDVTGIYRRMTTPGGIENSVSPENDPVLTRRRARP